VIATDFRSSSRSISPHAGSVQAATEHTIAGYPPPAVEPKDKVGLDIPEFLQRRRPHVIKTGEAGGSRGGNSYRVSLLPAPLQENHPLDHLFTQAVPSSRSISRIPVGLDDFGEVATNNVNPNKNKPFFAGFRYLGANYLLLLGNFGLGDCVPAAMLLRNSVESRFRAPIGLPFSRIIRLSLLCRW